MPRTTARDYTANISAAEAASKPPVAVGTFHESAAAILHTPKPRPAATAEPVDTSLVNWRRPEWWETVLIIKARHEARAREAAQLAGLT